MFIATERTTLSKKRIMNTRMRKDVSKDSFKLGVNFGVVTRLREN